MSRAFSDINPNYNGTNYSSHDIEIYKPLSSAGKEHFKLDSNADKYRHWGNRKKKMKLRHIKSNSVLKKNHFAINIKRPEEVPPQFRIRLSLDRREKR